MGDEYRDPAPMNCGVTDEESSESALDDGSIASTSKGIVYRHHARWNIDASLLVDLNAWKKYHADFLARLEELITKGSSNIKVSNKPKRTVNQIENYKTGNKNKNNKKPKINWSVMNANEFSSHLKEFVISSNEKETSTEMPTGDATIMCEFIKRKYGELHESTLKSYINFGRYLIIFKEWFDNVQIQTKCKDTWEGILNRETGISASSARQYRSLAVLVNKYPGLGNLSINFTEMRKMLPKIEDVFKDEIISSQWV